MGNSRILMETPRFLIIGYKKTKKENFYCLWLDDKEIDTLITSFYQSTGEKENGFEILKSKQKFSELTAEEKSEFLKKIVPVMLKRPKIEDDLNFDALHCTTPFIENFCKILTPLVEWASQNEMDISNVLTLLKFESDFFITFWGNESAEYDIKVKNDKFIIETNDKILTTDDLEVIKNYLKK
jgi:hypothetical protein